MFCRQCGKELTDGIKFCKYCGASQDAGNPPVTAGEGDGGKAGSSSQITGQKKKSRKKPKKGKGAIIVVLVVILLAIAVGVGVVLYFTSDSYQINKNLSLAEACYAEEYEEALSHYETALRLDRSLAEAYLGSADIYIKESEYQSAADILRKGLKKVRGEKKEVLKEKLRDIYSQWVTALISREDYNGARAVLDEGIEFLDADVLAKERQRIDQAESGEVSGAGASAREEGSIQGEETVGAENSPQAEGTPQSEKETESMEYSESEKTFVSEAMQESSENVPEETEQSRFILPESDSRYLTMEDLEGLTAEECRIARNELFARHGRLFKDEELQTYFDSCDWYYGWIMPEDFDETVFNEYEFANRDLIIKYEKEQGYR